MQVSNQCVTGLGQAGRQVMGGGGRKGRKDERVGCVVSGASGELLLLLVSLAWWLFTVAACFG